MLTMVGLFLDQITQFIYLFFDGHLHFFAVWTQWSRILVHISQVRSSVASEQSYWVIKCVYMQLYKKKSYSFQSCYATRNIKESHSFPLSSIFYISRFLVLFFPQISWELYFMFLIWIFWITSIIEHFFLYLFLINVLL